MKAFLFSMLLLSSGASLAQTMEEYAAKYLPYDRVNDYGHLLTRTEENRLTQLLEQISAEDRTEWAICVVPGFGGHKRQDLAKTMHGYWRFGERQYSVLIVYGVKEQKVTMSLGSWSAKRFPRDNPLSILSEQMAPDIIQKDYYAALYDGVEALYSHMQKTPKDSPTNYLPWVIGITFFVMLVPGIFMLRRGMRVGQYGGISQKRVGNFPF